MCRAPQHRVKPNLPMRLPGWLLIFSLIWLASSTSGDAQDTSAGTVLHVHGTVVNGVTGKPISRALVVSDDQRLATMTDTEGHFSLDVTEHPGAINGLSGGVTMTPRGSLALTPRKPGFSRQVQPTLVSLDPVSAASNVELKLMPVCSIEGQVTASNQEPASGVNVTLLERRVEEGQQVWRQQNGGATNSRGEFHFSNLEPGEYTVLAAEWLGDDQITPRQQLHEITTQFPPDFAGDTSTLDSATRLHLHFGDATHVELHLHAATYYPVILPVTGSPMGISVRVGGAGAGAGGFDGFALGYNSRNHNVEGSLPDGEYTVLLSQYGDHPGFAVLPIHIADAPFQGSTVALAPGRPIPVRVEQQFTKASSSSDTIQLGVVNGGKLEPPPLAQIYLSPLDPGAGGANSKTGADGKVELESVPPGEYTVHANGTRGYVASLTSGGVDLLHHTLVVSLGGRVEPIDVVLRDDTGTVAGTIKLADDAHPLSQVTFLELLPQGAAGIFTQGFAAQDGKFQVENVAPGNYRILAFRGSMRAIAYRDPKSLEAWNGKGVTVTVTAGGQAQVDVPLLDESEVQPE